MALPGGSSVTASPETEVTGMGLSQKRKKHFAPSSLLIFIQIRSGLEGILWNEGFIPGRGVKVE